jgi:hypothetical protein
LLPSFLHRSYFEVQRYIAVAGIKLILVTLGPELASFSSPGKPRIQVDKTHLIPKAGGDRFAFFVFP